MKGKPKNWEDNYIRKVKNHQPQSPSNWWLKNTGCWFQTFFFHFHPYYLGKIPMLTNIFQRGWNHQLVVLSLVACINGTRPQQFRAEHSYLGQKPDSQMQPTSGVERRPLWDIDEKTTRRDISTFFYQNIKNVFTSWIWKYIVSSCLVKKALTRWEGFWQEELVFKWSSTDWVTAYHLKKFSRPADFKHRP